MTSSVSSPSRERLPQLDALRAFAVLGVILHHAVKWEFRLPVGPYCVRLFFVLSGYLITGILLNAREKSLDRNRCRILEAFYARRLLRIFPIYYLSLALLCLVGQRDLLETIWWHLGYLSNVLNSQPTMEIAPVWGHLWSLSVEEQFYLIWPALVLFLPRRWLCAAFIVVIVSAPIYRVLATSYWGFKAALFLTPGCLDSLGAGALLAWLVRQSGRSALRSYFCRIALPLGVILIAAASLLFALDLGWRLFFAISDLGIALVSVWMVNAAVIGFPGWIGRVLQWPPLVYLGTISYGMYLFHNFLPALCDLSGIILPDHGGGRFILLFVMTVSLATVSWHVFESPINKLKDRFAYVPLIKAEPATYIPESRHAKGRAT